MPDPLPIDAHLDTIRDLVRTHRAAVVVQNFGGGEPWIDLDAQRFRLLRQPAAYVAQAHHVGAMIRETGRQHEARHLQ